MSLNIAKKTVQLVQVRFLSKTRKMPMGQDHAGGHISVVNASVYCNRKKKLAVIVEQLVTCAYEKSCRNVVQCCIKQPTGEVGDDKFGQTFHVGYTSLRSHQGCVHLLSAFACIHASMHVLFFLCILFMQSYYNALVLCFLFVHFTNLHLQGSPQNAVCPLREAGMYS